MDLQLGPPSRARILPKAEEAARPDMDGRKQRRMWGGHSWPPFAGWVQRGRSLLEEMPKQGPRAEALATEYIVRSRPVWSWFVAEWRRLGTVAAVLLTFGLLLHAVFGANGMVVFRQKRDELKAVQIEVDRIQKENDGYAARIRALKSDPNAIEKEAREQLHYTRPGEMVYVMPEVPQKPPTGRAKNGK